MNIDNLIGTIGTAVFEAHKAIENHSIVDFFQNYFDKRENVNGIESFQPKMIEVEVPGLNGERKKVGIPVAVMVNHGHLNIDSVKLNLNINVVEDADNSFAVSTQATGGDGKKAGEMEILFKYSDTVEGIARIETQLNSLL